MGLFGKSRKEKEQEAAYFARIGVPALLQQDFSMRIDAVFETKDGVVVAGRAGAGACRVGESALVCGPQGELETKIGAIDLRTRERRPDGTLYATELAGVALRGLRKEQVHPGDVLMVYNAGRHTR